ncbi:uncharacterized protein BCR38DRAFT_410323 [Pseudomassariella vexata]|uniref:MYND-type domain-containing protein n=1 Tax=Pseudomassariella vexata TaxID=1141098 RepID=A0A1Y2DVV2_9PEZI|nr:uncharacterized protein BCR38DRAFT_410323 [Pseudomassariella vexata]ORY63393.1 hypothetical protein BCR38DRAFT_410323 [Pseudomassariella vexata]
MSGRTQIYSHHLPDLVAALREVVKETAPEDKAIRGRCTYCDRPGKNTCGQCNSAKYCSAACQKKDWPTHKVLCYQFVNDFQDSKRPSYKHVRGILFPAGENKPKFIWVRQIHTSNQARLILSEHLHCTESTGLADSCTFDWMPSKFEKHGHGLMVLKRCLFPPSGDIPINKSILSLSKPGHMKLRFGNHLFLAHKSGREATYLLDDTDLRDFRHAIDYYQQSPYNPCVVDPERYPLPTVPGLLLHCDGALRRLFEFGVTKPIEQVIVPRKYPSDCSEFIEEQRVMATEQMGLPWYIRRWDPRLEWPVDQRTLHNLRNERAEKLIRKRQGPAEIAAQKDEKTRKMYEKYAQQGISIFEHVHDAGSAVLYDIRENVGLQPIHLVAMNGFIDADKVTRMSRGDKVVGGCNLLGKEDRPRKEMMMAFESWFRKWKGLDLESVVSPFALGGGYAEAWMWVDIMNKMCVETLVKEKKKKKRLLDRSDMVDSAHDGFDQVDSQRVVLEVDGEQVAAELIGLGDVHLGDWEHVNTEHTASDHVNSTYASLDQVDPDRIHSEYVDSNHVDLDQVNLKRVHSKHVNLEHINSEHVNLQVLGTQVETAGLFVAIDVEECVSTRSISTGTRRMST